jgi:coenzyme F420-dependent glucose-6-phosphate dehydrogenase
VELGFTLSSEEFGASELVDVAVRAERAGFAFAMISDHFHPWTDRQGNSPFVWGVLGALAASTERIRIGTGVTCPIIRLHPAIVAQAAATAAALMPGRFFLGVGTGENLNEHILGDRWPTPDVRLEMLEEAIEVMRSLWTGEQTTWRGKHFTVEEARVYSLPEEPPDIMVGARGAGATELAGRLGDGLIAVAPSPETIERFENAGGAGKPRYGQVHVCWAVSEEEARRTAFEVWPNAAMEGALGSELRVPKHYEEAAKMLTEDQVAEKVVCGPDPERHLSAIREFTDAGFDHVYVHQIGADQDGAIDFYEREVMPKLG